MLMQYIKLIPKYHNNDYQYVIIGHKYLIVVIFIFRLRKIIPTYFDISCHSVVSCHNMWIMRNHYHDHTQIDQPEAFNVHMHHLSQNRKKYRKWNASKLS